MKKILFISLLTLLSTLTFADDLQVPDRGGKGKITIMLEPAGSDVFLDGEFVGKSPIKEKEFKTGRFDLIVIDQGQELIHERFNVWPDKVNEYTGKTVMPFGNINIDSGDKKCDIYINGDYADRTAGGPLLIRNLDAGDHLVEAKCGGKALELLVALPGEQTVDVVVDTKKRTIKLKEN